MTGDIVLREISSLPSLWNPFFPTRSPPEFASTLFSLQGLKFKILLLSFLSLENPIHFGNGKHTKQ